MTCMDTVSCSVFNAMDSILLVETWEVMAMNSDAPVTLCWRTVLN